MSSDFSGDIAAVFAEDGPLARAVAGYRPRAGQIEMAQAVARAAQGGLHALEAGTGVGKTFAYLAPVFQYGISAVVSTGTRALQDQLIRRDIPALAEALARPVRAVALKGRANYVCKKRVAEGGGELVSAKQWERVSLFAAKTETGDIRDEPGFRRILRRGRRRFPPARHVRRTSASITTSAFCIGRGRRRGGRTLSWSIIICFWRTCDCATRESRRFCRSVI